MVTTRLSKVKGMIAVCAGSFDPVTLGHIDVFGRAATLCDRLVVAVVHNPHKPSGIFEPATRMDFIRSGLEEAGLGDAGIEIDQVAGGLLVDYCREIGANALIKGLRTTGDYAYELPMAHMNRHLSGIETVFLPGDPAFEYVSSSLVKEVARYGGDVSALVPTSVGHALVEHFAQD